MDETDPESVEFNETLGMVRDGTIDEDKQKVLIKKCSMYNMGMEKFGSCGFDDDGVSQIFVNN